MLVACRLAGLSALEAHYAGVVTLRRTGKEFKPRWRNAKGEVHIWLEPRIVRQAHGDSDVILRVARGGAGAKR